MRKLLLMALFLLFILSIFGSYYLGDKVLPSLSSPYYKLPAYYTYPHYNYQSPYYGYGYGYLNYPSQYSTYTPIVRYTTRYIPRYVPVTTATYGWQVNYHYAYTVPTYTYYPYYHTYSYASYPTYYYTYGW